MLDRIGELINNNTVLFAGYGLRDEHIRRLLTAIRRRRGVWVRDAYAIGFCHEVRAKLLESRGIQVIAGDAEQLLADLTTCAFSSGI